MYASNFQTLEAHAELPLNKITFPLLKLPSLALDEVLKSMELLELIPFSLVSNKTQKIVKSFVKSKSNKLEICYYGNCRSYLKLSSENYKSATVNINVLYHSFVAKWSSVVVDNAMFCVGSDFDTDIFTIWKDTVEGFEFFIAYFCYIFNPKISLDLKFNYESLLLTGIFDAIKKQNVTLTKAEITGPHESSNLYQKFLELPSKNISICYQPNGMLQPSKDPKTFMTQYIVEFLQKWMVSDTPVEFLSVDKSFIDFCLIGKSLSLTPIKKAKKRDDGYQIFGHLQNEYCFEIQRTDGKKAIIYNGDFDIIFKTDSY